MKKYAPFKHVVLLLVSILYPLCSNAFEKVNIPAPSFIASGLPNDVPMTFVFGKNAQPLVFAASDHQQNQSLEKFFSTNGAQLPSVDATTTKYVEQLRQLLTKNGYALEKLIASSNRFTVVNVEIGESLGKCAPCTERHASVIEGASTAHRGLDAAYVVIYLVQP